MTDRSDETRPLWRRKRWLVLLLLLISTWFGYRSYAANRNYNRVLALQASFDNPNLPTEERQKLFGDFRTAMNALTPAQRQLLDQDRQKRQEAEMDRYFAMSRPEQKKYLDEKIRSMQKRMTSGPGGAMQNAAFGGGRPTGGAPTLTKSPGSGGKSNNPDDIEARKKKMLDHTSADLRAKRDRFRTDMEKRAKELGVTLPSGGPGRTR